MHERAKILSEKELKRAFSRLRRIGIGAFEAYNIAMTSASKAGYSL